MDNFVLYFLGYLAGAVVGLFKEIDVYRRRPTESIHYRQSLQHSGWPGRKSAPALISVQANYAQLTSRRLRTGRECSRHHLG